MENEMISSIEYIKISLPLWHCVEGVSFENANFFVKI